MLGHYAFSRLASLAPRVAVALGAALAFCVPGAPARAQLGLADFVFVGGFDESRVGESIAVGDFNGDGYDDLALGMPSLLTEPMEPGAGGVFMAYGGPGAWSSIDIIIPSAFGAFQFGARFGATLAAGDFDADGFDDLAIGLPERTISGQSSAGQVVVVYGSAQNLDLENPQFLSQVTLEGAPEAGDRLGSSLAAGDLSGDGIDDLAIGVPFEDLPGEVALQVDAGAVNVIYGVAGEGLQTASSQFLHEDSPGVGFNANSGENFGFSLTIGQFTGNAFTDLAVGVPREIVLGPGAKGAVVIFPGAVGGIDPIAGVEVSFSQETPGVLGTAEVGDQFGYSLASGNFDGDLWTDLAIGVPGESELGETGSGAVQVLYGGPIGLTNFGDQFFVESSFDPDVDPFDSLGVALAAGDFNADGRDDLAIGAPLDNSLGVQDAGEIDVLYGTADGLAIAGGQVFNMIFFGTLEADDLFGWSLAAGRFFSPSAKGQDLVVGVPGFGGPVGSDPGAVVVIRSLSIFADGFESGNLGAWTDSVL